MQKLQKNYLDLFIKSRCALVIQQMGKICRLFVTLPYWLLNNHSEIIDKRILIMILLHTNWPLLKKAVHFNPFNIRLSLSKLTNCFKQKSIAVGSTHPFSMNIYSSTFKNRYLVVSSFWLNPCCNSSNLFLDVEVAKKWR